VVRLLQANRSAPELESYQERRTEQGYKELAVPNDDELKVKALL
jgi:hypothetical protein